MKTVYTSIMNRLKAEVPELKWIGLNVGQLALSESIPSIVYPCAMINITMPQCSDITDTVQFCNAIIGITLAFDPLDYEKASSNSTDLDRDEALIPYDIIAEVYKCLQGFETSKFNALSRVYQGPESHDRLFVYKINMKCEFEDITADCH